MSTIQWFPGHMAKARREVNEKLSLVDIVLELVDARIPESSRNPLIDEIIKQKPRIIVLNKSDLANSHKTNQWITFYRDSGNPAIAIDAQHHKGINQLEKECQRIMVPYFEKQRAKGVKPRPIRLMILGIPNVGKSTLINRFVGKNQAITGNKPGVTKSQRWLKMGKEFELLDTPGILWPKFEDPNVGKKLALTGAIKDQLLPMEDLALFLLDYLRSHQPETLKHLAHLDDEQSASLRTEDLLIAVTKKFGMKDDYYQAAQKLIFDYRQQKFGNLTLDDIPVTDYE